MNVLTQPTEKGREVPSKATLFCPDCHHYSRYDGDWNVVETTCKTHWNCPNCGMEIAARPTAACRNTRSYTEMLWQPWTDGTRLWFEFWADATDAVRSD